MDEDTQAIVRLESSALSETDAAQELAVDPAEEMAAGVSKVLDLIAERLELETPHPSTARRVRGARTVSRGSCCRSWPRRSAKDTRNADLAAEVENMRRHLGRKGARKKKAKKGEPPK